MTKGRELNRKVYLNPENLRVLKEPFGILLESSRINRGSLIRFTKQASLIISVGDATTDRLGSFGIVPDLSVVDGKEQRFQRDIRGGEFLSDDLNLECHNPAGHVTEDAVHVLEAAIKACSRGPVRVIVKGEEDLLVLPLMLMVPSGSTVMYGQPSKGIVIISVDSASRKKAKHLLESLRLKWERGYDDAVAE